MKTIWTEVTEPSNGDVIRTKLERIKDINAKKIKRKKNSSSEDINS